MLYSAAYRSLGVLQPSGPTDIVADEDIHKELGNSLVRAATTASSLEAEQDSGGGPRCQETMGDTIAQTRVLDLEKTKTTQQNEIASLKRRVKKLEQKKRSRTHGLKRLNKVGISRRVESFGDEEDLDDADAKMFDVGTLTGDEVFAAEQEVAAKYVNLNVDELVLPVLQQRKGIVITEPGESTTTKSSQLSLQQSQDKGKGIMIEELVKPKKKDVQIMLDEEAAKKLQAEFDEEERLAREKDKANIAWDDIQANVDADYQLAERLQAEEQEQFTIKEKATLFKELLEQRRKHFAAKRAEEKRNKPPTKNQQKKTMITYLKNMEGWKHKDLKSKDFDSIKELLDKAFKRVNMFVDFRTYLVEGNSKRAEEELEQESTKKQKVDKDTAELQSLMEVISDEEEVAIDAVPLATKSPKFVGWKIHKEGKKSYYQIMRADGKS
ncbi:hypothetical protein Tco_0904403 [Tanacetum coccineum]